jgi:hypothetical protein
MIYVIEDPDCVMFVSSARISSSFPPDLANIMSLVPLGGEACPYFSPFFGFAGAASAMVQKSHLDILRCRCCLRHCKGRERYCWRRSNQTRIDDEISHPCSHGWYYRRLWFGCCRAYCKRYGSAETILCILRRYSSR